MAKRYSGNLQISVIYDDRGHYRTAVSSGGKLLWRGTVRPAPAGFGPGVAYDSPQAYDKIAQSTLSFADDAKRGIGDQAEFDENLTEYKIRRTPHSGSHRQGQPSRKSPASSGKIVVRKISGRWQPVDESGAVVQGNVYNDDGSGYSTRKGAAEAAEMLRQFGGRA
jgi:hypothetical protein